MSRLIGCARGASRTVIPSGRLRPPLAGLLIGLHAFGPGGIIACDKAGRAGSLPHDPTPGILNERTERTDRGLAGAHPSTEGLSLTSQPSRPKWRRSKRRWLSRISGTTRRKRRRRSLV